MNSGSGARATDRLNWLDEPSTLAGSAVDRPARQGEIGGAWDGYLVGDENQLAYSAVLAIARGEPLVALPLCVLGPSGSGKTRLLAGLAREWKARYPGGNVVSTTGPEWREVLYREASGPDLDMLLQAGDLLLVDEVGALGGSPVGLLAFASALERVLAAGAAVVLSGVGVGGRGSGQKGWPARLSSVVGAGMRVRLEEPGAEMRRRYVLRRLEQNGPALSVEAIDWLVGVARGFRVLDGMLTRLEFAARARGKVDGDQAFSVDHLRTLFSEHAAAAERGLEAAGSALTNARSDDPVAWLSREICRCYGIALGALLGGTRTSRVVEARHLAIQLAREHFGLSYAELGRRFGGRDPKSIRHACEAMARRRAQQPVLDALAHDIAARLR